MSIKVKETFIMGQSRFEKRIIKEKMEAKVLILLTILLVFISIFGLWIFFRNIDLLFGSIF
jgi:hypothetical protein